jgi:hypothetical protein
MKYFTLFLLLCSIPATKAQQTNQNVSGGLVFDGEPFLAINPSNTQHLVVAWMGWKLNNQIVIKTKYSINGGSTWSPENHIPHAQASYSSADPSVEFDLDGNVYVCFIDYDNQNFTGGSIFTVKSTNGGESWGAPVEVISLSDCPGKYCIDRPWMVIDQSNSSYSGTIYITSMNANQNVVAPYNPYLTISTDGGATYGTPRFLDTINYYAGNTIKQPMPSPAVSADGTFYAMYSSYLASQSVFGHYYLAKSTNQGVTITHTSAVQIGAGMGVTDNYAKKGYLLITNPNNVQHLALLTLGQTHGDADIFMIESVNGGVNWSSPFRINQDPIGNGILQDLVWADFNENGDLAIAWRDRRSAIGTGYQVASEIWGVIRKNGQSNFSTDFLISDAPSPHDEVLEGSGNDFMCVQFVHDTLYAVWGDVRNAKLNIWLNKININNGLSVQTAIHATDFLTLSPNPASDLITIHTTTAIGAYSILDLEGTLITTGSSTNNTIDIRHLKTGFYLLGVEVNGEIYHQKFIKE